MSSSIKLILAIVVIAGLGFVGFQYVSGAPKVTDDLTRVGVSDTSKMGAEVLSALNQLQQLKLDSSIFSNKTFKSLKDFSRPLPTEPIGRPNPFAPIGADAGSVKPESNATSTFSVFGNSPSGKVTSTSTSKATNTKMTASE